ncbi:hypothetical protein EV183_002545 [Coemansia sp. RSA 2336]|nr:hypothetical protein EV183_002545 [Coemansia sp. RSA 2336]
MKTIKHALVTGFEPFGSPRPSDNRSWEAAKRLEGQTLETDNADIVCHCYRLPVSYGDVSTQLPLLHKSNTFSIVLHCGAGTPGTVRLEKQAHKTGYTRPGNKGPQDLPPGGSVPGYQTENELASTIDVDSLHLQLESAGWHHISTSTDAGRYLCDFTYYTSLAEAQVSYPARQLPAAQTVFVHVHPQVNDIYSDEQLAELLRSIIRMLGSNIASNESTVQ